MELVFNCKFFFILYLLLIIIFIIWIKFTKSFEELQYYSTYFIDYDWKEDNLTTENFFNYTEDKSLSLLKCCVLSSIIYSNELNFSNPSYFNKVYKLDCLTFLRNKKIKGFLATSKDFVVISIVSTSNMEDILVSSNANKIDIEDGEIHEGYYTQAIEILTKITEILSNHRDIKKIYLSGHSFGGTIISIIGYLLAKNDYHDVCCYSFGGVKYGDKTLKYNIEKMTNLKIYNILNIADLIIHKPLINNFIRIGEDIKHRIDTGNDNLNHSIKVYRECVLKVENSEIKGRSNRFYENIFRMVLDFI